MIYVIFFLMLLGVASNGLLKKYALVNIEYKRELSKKAAEVDEELELTTVVENSKILPVTFIQVHEKFPCEMKYISDVNITEVNNYIHHTSTMVIMPYQRIKRTYNVSFSYRGRYILRDAELISGDMLGLSVTSKAIEYWQEIVVYPKALDLEEMLEPYGDYMGNISVVRWIVEDPILTIGVNEYSGREPQKHINWPVSLRAGKLMVNKFDHTIDNNIMIILNIACLKPLWLGIEEEKLETVLSITRALMEQFEKQGIPYGFISNIQGFSYRDGKDLIEPSIGNAHFFSILDGLGRAEYSPNMNFKSLLETVIYGEKSIGTFVIVTPEVPDECIQHINSLGKSSDKTTLICLGTNNIDGLNRDIRIFSERGEKNE